MSTPPLPMSTLPRLGSLWRRHPRAFRVTSPAAGSYGVAVSINWRITGTLTHTADPNPQTRMSGYCKTRRQLNGSAQDRSERATLRDQALAHGPELGDLARRLRCAWPPQHRLDGDLVRVSEGAQGCGRLALRIGRSTRGMSLPWKRAHTQN